MKGDKVFIFVIFVLISINMCSCQKKAKKKHDKKKLQLNTHDGRKVEVTNWGHYGWKSGQEVDAKILKEILNGLALFERGEFCPFGEGKCESVSAVYVLSKLIKELLNKKGNDCNENGDCDPDENEHKDLNNATKLLSEKSNISKSEPIETKLKEGQEESKLLKLLFVSNDFEKKRLLKRKGLFL
ncbi:uncharacterized protein LOC133527365 [Cydia pomonella]|uniref:uncharacterized protein LOC133527365 n=1 Tax=Cydia pomonella TaxID=82600 RepID=UPI002ADD55A9|nr:uncharacterized protein LOC133527365 [Cydia pomonella]